MAGFRGRGIRFKMTAVATAGALLASVVVVIVTAWALQSVLERSIADELRDHLDKAQEAVAIGNYEAAVLFTGSDIMQVIAEDGTVLSSSANARDLAAIVEGSDDSESILEPSGLRLREVERDEDGKPDDEEDGSSETPASSDSPADGEGDSGVQGGRDDDDDGDDDDYWDDLDDDDDDGWDGRGDDDGRSGDGWDELDDDDDRGDDAGDDRGDGAGDDEDGESDDEDGESDADDADDDADDGETRRAGAANTSSLRDGAQDNGRDGGGDGSAIPQAPTSDRGGFNGGENDGADDDSDDDADDDDDDESNDGKKRMRATSLFVQRAYAAQSEQAPSSGNDVDEGPYLDASNVFGNEGPYLVMQRKVESPDGTVTLAAMASLAPAVHAVRVAAQLLVVVMAVLLVAVAFFSWRLTGRTLRPVEQMRANVAAINEGDLSMRVDVPQGDRDLAPLAETFNELLGRIEASVERQKHFISDASHELKSPVAATGVMLEALREYPGAIDVDQAIGDLSDENERMGRIVGNMLVLARHDEGRTVVEPAPVDLYDLVHEEAARLAHATSFQIDTVNVSPVVCTTDRELLSHVLRNLFDNAGHYARSRVSISCEEREDAIRITVSDDGPGIAPADRERVFDRFVRLEEGESRRKESTGLGLSVVKSSVEQLGGTVRFADPEIGGATAVVELPLG